MSAVRATLVPMDIATPITGTRVDTVLEEIVSIALCGDFRARRVTLWGAAGIVPDRTAVITPHRDRRGLVDEQDLIGQIYALAHGSEYDSTDTYYDYVSVDGRWHRVPAWPSDND